MIFRFVTYNILYGGKRREDVISRLLEHMQADAILLQEVRNPAFIRELSGRLGLEFFIANGNMLNSTRVMVMDLCKHSLGISRQLPSSLPAGYNQEKNRKTIAG